MKHAWTVCLWLLTSALALAAPNREPSGRAVPEEAPAVAIDKLANDSGATFGNWHVWGFQAAKPASGVESGGPSIVLINKQSGLVLYVPWTSNGWINHRTPDRAWYVMFPGGGAPSPQDRADLNIDRFVGRQPMTRLATGKHEVRVGANKDTRGWTVTVTEQSIEFSGQNAARIRLNRDSVEFVYGNRTIK